MATFNQIFKDIQSQLGPLAEKSVKEFSGEAKQDAEAFFGRVANKIEEMAAAAGREEDRRRRISLAGGITEIACQNGGFANDKRRCNPGRTI